MKKNNEQPVGDAIKDMFKAFHLDEKVNEVRIKEVWTKVMGNSIANYTSDIKLKKGILSIALNSAPLKQDLTYNRNKIIERINEEMGERIVTEVIIR